MPNDNLLIGAEIFLYNGWKFKNLLPLQKSFLVKRLRVSENGIE